MNKIGDMKKLISICFLFLFVVLGNAQENKKPKWSELNQDQLNLALTKSIGTIRTGEILTITGGSVAGIGGLIMIAAGAKWLIDGSDNTNTATTGFGLFIAGGITMYIGIPVWIVGAVRKKNITLELVKFNPRGSASINGIGLKIRF
jgi:hypothetical protein